VGSPPDQNMPSMIPAAIAVVVSLSDIASVVTSLSGFRPAAVSIRRAITSVPELWVLVEIRRPRISGSEPMPASVRTITWA
jgi:hypothetical protein